MKKLINSILIIVSVIAMVLIIACSSYAELTVVNKVSIDRYMGKWYEIASFPQSFQRNCYCTTAEYTFIEDEGFVKVFNSCNKNSPDGEIDTAEGKAFVVEGSNNAKLEVTFFPPFKGDYWVIELAPDYSYAVVGSPNRRYLWVLSRTPKMDDDIYNMLLEKIEQKEFDISKLEITDQSCDIN